MYVIEVATVRNNKKISPFDLLYEKSSYYLSGHLIILRRQ